MLLFSRKPDVASKIESESISKDSSLHHSDDEEKDERDEDVARRKKLDEEGEVWELVQDASTFIPRNTGSLRESEGSRLLADKLSNSNRKPETLYESMPLLLLSHIQFSFNLNNQLDASG